MQKRVSIKPKLIHFYVIYLLKPYSGWAFSGLLTDEGRGQGKKTPHPKICHTNLTMMKLGTVIPYLKKVQKTYESHDTSIDFC